MKKNAFTLAEVLITLAIIGVVSALVIPSVLKNYNDKKYNTARLKALKTFGEAGKLASINGEINGQPTARAFVENVLSKYLKITKVCDNVHPNDCGFPSEIQPSNPNANKLSVDSTHLVTWGQLGSRNHTTIASPISDTNMSIIIATNDGFSGKIFYNPKCIRNFSEGRYLVDQACLNVIYDMNGLKGPNHVGEDIGIVTVFWSGLNTIAVAPGIIPYSIAKAIHEKGNNLADAQKDCVNSGTIKIPLTLPNIDEIASLYMNNQLTSLSGSAFWSGSPVVGRPGFVWMIDLRSYRGHGHPSYGFGGWCVRR